MSTKKIFNELVKQHSQCDLAFIPILNLNDREKEYFKSFMSKANTAIVIYYPMKNSDDYIWYCPDGKIESERCNIDDWSNDICKDIQKELLEKNFKTKIIPYPGISGLQFRYVACASGYGELGKNAFYLHPVYGAKVHLRLLVSEIKSKVFCSIKVKKKKVCLNCNECINNCPANAFKDGFDGLKCRAFRKKRGEYRPVGESGILRYCRKCIYSCKAGINMKDL